MVLRRQSYVHSLSFPLIGDMCSASGSKETAHSNNRQYFGGGRREGAPLCLSHISHCYTWSFNCCVHDYSNTAQAPLSSSTACWPKHLYQHSIRSPAQTPVLEFNCLPLSMENIFDQINEWFKTNLLTINMDKTNYIQFKTKNKSIADLKIISNNRLVTPVCNTKFLGLHINDSINWNHHIDHISKKLSTVCYIMRNIKSYMPLNTMIIVYYSYFNSMMSYGLPFWGISPYSLEIFRIQKKNT